MRDIAATASPALVQHRSFQPVQRLFAMAERVPALRLRDLERRFVSADARLQADPFGPLGDDRLAVEDPVAKRGFYGFRAGRG
ncbi:hypothetical protein OMP40_23445 [Cohnella rhizosphaerae]|uniref:Uncharacterized protein n=1 Tax=Cohnella rhizosphaerae TaxID=1457232 RepID=A0A9X4L1S0_9BACL|nr:hypothetical protein [Cohnella rhizosphaerae]MDG0811989.1 hypothetical protein [Cohnella rhizosphaerae]